MTFILRWWQCQNDACGALFEDGDPAPACPDCGNVKVSWGPPGGGHIRHAKTAHADMTLRSVAKQFNLTNLKSARAGESAHPGLPTPKPMNEKLFHGIPWSTSATAGFAAPGTRSTVKINAGVQETGAIRTVKPGKGVPTQIHRTPDGAPMIDNRKVV